MNGFAPRLIAAFRFLTVFPVPGTLGRTNDDLAGSLVFFPLVGLFLGMLAALAAFVFWSLLPGSVAGVGLTVVLLSFSGGLHLDGLADTADGFFSSRPRERILVIMRDSRIGAMGVIALVLLLLLKAAALGSLSLDKAVRAALFMPLAGRCAIVLFMALLPYARPEGGLGSLFYSRRSRKIGFLGAVVLVAAGLLTAGGGFLVPVTMIGLLLGLFALFCRKMIGGATGDTLGAACELSEAAAALSFALLAGSGQ